MAEQFRMPPMGQTSTSLTILQWKVSDGDAVKQGDVLAEVETDKATLDVESYLGGTVLKVLREEGDTVEVGEPIAIIGEAGEDIAALLAEIATGSGTASGSGESAAKDSASADVAANTGSTSGVTAAVSQQATAGSRPPGPGKVLASPVARKLAKIAGIDLTAVRGTGPGGRITKADVAARASSDSGRTAFAPTVGPASDRSIVAARVAKSFQTIPHVYLTTSVDMSVAAAQLSSARAGSATKVTYTHILLRAIGAALLRNPKMNAVWDESGTPAPVGKANVGVVVAGGSQLMIVSIDEPGRHSLGQIATATAEAVGRARSASLLASDFAPCAVSMSNLGMFAVDEFQAIIDPDQSSMVSVGRISDRVVAIGGAIAVRPMVSISVAADHRVVDGVDVAAFLDDIKRTVETG